MTDLADSNEIVYFSAMGSTNFKINKLSVMPRRPLKWKVPIVPNVIRRIPRYLFIFLIMIILICEKRASSILAQNALNQ